jgi:hypothetical protein
MTGLLNSYEFLATKATSCGNCKRRADRQCDAGTTDYALYSVLRSQRHRMYGEQHGHLTLLSALVFPP